MPLLPTEVPEALTVSEDENQHEQELLGLIEEEHLKYMGSIVLGLNDALVEILGTLAGLTFALQNTKLVALSGIIAGIAGALSMASSEYLSNRAEGKDELAIKSAIFTGIAYVIAVIFLVAPYLIFTSVYIALLVALLDSILIVFSVHLLHFGGQRPTLPKKVYRNGHSKYLRWISLFWTRLSGPNIPWNRCLTILLTFYF